MEIRLNKKGILMKALLFHWYPYFSNISNDVKLKMIEEGVKIATSRSMQWKDNMSVYNAYFAICGENTKFTG